jgi:hypothetical protein
MKKLCTFFTLFFLSALCNIVKAQNTVPGQIIIDIKHENLPINTYINGQGIILSGISSLDTLNARFGVYAFEKLTDDSWNATRGMYLLRFPNSHDVNLVHFLYSSDTHIHLAGLCGFRYPAVIPSDYYFSQQWGLSRIKCPEAWRYTNGKSSIIIQIIDGGTDYGHPDLMKNIWQNLSEDADGDGHTIEWNAVQNRWILDPGDTNHVDNDNNGFADDLVGWDFILMIKTHRQKLLFLGLIMVLVQQVSQQQLLVIRLKSEKRHGFVIMTLIVSQVLLGSVRL